MQCSYVIIKKVNIQTFVFIILVGLQEVRYDNDKLVLVIAGIRLNIKKNC